MCVRVRIREIVADEFYLLLDNPALLLQVFQFLCMRIYVSMSWNCSCDLIQKSVCVYRAQRRTVPTYMILFMFRFHSCMFDSRQNQT